MEVRVEGFGVLVIKGRWWAAKSSRISGGGLLHLPLSGSWGRL